MIEVPPTTSWPRLTFTSASNFSTVCTNLAEARACNPFLLQILSTRIIGAWSGGSSAEEDSPAASFIAGEHAAGDGDVFAAGVLGRRDGLGQRTLVAHLGELHQHREIDAGEDLDFRAPHHRDCKVGGGAAKHVGEDRHPLAAVHALDRLDDVLAALLDVVVGPDRYRLDLLLRADHVFQDRAELSGKAPMRDEYEADHGAPRRRVSLAPHERAPIMTIRSPGARAFLGISGCCCIAIKGAPSGAAGSGILPSGRLLLCHRRWPQGS